MHRNRLLHHADPPQQAVNTPVKPNVAGPHVLEPTSLLRCGEGSEACDDWGADRLRQNRRVKDEDRLAAGRDACAETVVAVTGPPPTRQADPVSSTDREDYSKCAH
jgi:hypothetical protein